LFSFHEFGRSEYDRLNPHLGSFKSKTLFHEPCWLQYLESTGKGTPKFFEIRDGQRSLGYFVFLERRLGPFNVMGSPLPGWTTNYMGPLVNDGIDQEVLVRSILQLARKRKYLYVELKNQILDQEVMKRCGFSSVANKTAVKSIGREESDILESMDGTARNRIRKAFKSNLELEIPDGMGAIDEYYVMIVERYREQGLDFPFGKERLYRLWECLKPSGRLLVLRIRREGRTIAAGLFPHDERCIYYFGGASLHDEKQYCPNELMHWEVMRFASREGIPEYDLCGTSRFKRKFGAVDIPFVAYSFSPVPGFEFMRKTAYDLHWRKLKIKQSFKNIFRNT
jgi:hypothetical protein